MSKLASLPEAIEQWVPNGSSVVTGCALESLIPFSAGHEIIRQRKADLTLVGPISDILFDQLIGAGCVSKVLAAWVGNVSAGLGHNYRRASEEGVPAPLLTEDHSNFSVSLGLLAGAMGIPYLPTKSLLGTDIIRKNRSFKVDKSPLDQEQLVLVPAIIPDVAILHAQRCDENGNAHVWGNLGVSREAMMAARKTILIAEEIVSRDLIVTDPNRVLGPSQKVVAVAHEPGGAHPSPVQGHYNRDHDFFHAYHLATRDEAGWQEWLREWVHDVPDRPAYLRKLGKARWQSLQLKEHRYAAPVDYGY